MTFLALTGCASENPPPANVQTLPSARDIYSRPESVDRGRLEYDANGKSFPVLMTQPDGYPTQAQANYAFQRSKWVSFQLGDNAQNLDAASVRIFSCRPGGLDGETGRVKIYGGPVVVCATDLLSADAQVLARVPLNFYFYKHVWRVNDPEPSYRPVPWTSKEESPSHSSGWFGNRY